MISNEVFEDLIINTFAEKYNSYHNSFFSNAVRIDKQITSRKMADYKLSDGKKLIFVEFIRLRYQYMNSLNKQNLVKTAIKELKNKIGGGYEIWFYWKIQENFSKKKIRENFINQIIELLKSNYSQKKSNLGKWDLSIKKNTTLLNKIRCVILLRQGGIDKNDLLKQIKESSPKFQNANREFGTGKNIFLMLQLSPTSNWLDITGLLQSPLFYYKDDLKKFTSYLKNIDEIYSIGLSFDMKSAIARVHPPDSVFFEAKFFENENRQIEIENYNENLFNYFKSGIIINDV